MCAPGVMLLLYSVRQLQASYKNSYLHVSDIKRPTYADFRLGARSVGCRAQWIGGLSGGYREVSDPLSKS